MTRLLPLLALVLAISCTSQKAKDEIGDSENVIVNEDGSKTVRVFYKNGKVKTEVVYKDSLRNGLAKSYDEQGNLLLEVPYRKGKREGESKRYYQGGVLFQTTEYRDDKMNGLQKKFRANGNQISEARYEDDYPCVGLREFLDNQKERSRYPQIIFTESDRINSTGVYTVEVSMSGNVRKAKYFSGRLTKNGCLSDNAYPLQPVEGRPVAVIQYKLAPGQFLMEELNIIAIAETLNGNDFVTQKSFHVSIKN